MSENPENGEGKIVNPPNNLPSGENTDGEIVNPGMAADVDDGVGDAGDQANDVRFAQEQSLIGEQSQGVFPEATESEQVPAEEPTMDEAAGAGNQDGSAADGDSSDDPAHSGGTA